MIDSETWFCTIKQAFNRYLHPGSNHHMSNFHHRINNKSLRLQFNLKIRLKTKTISKEASMMSISTRPPYPKDTKPLLSMPTTPRISQGLSPSTINFQKLTTTSRNMIKGQHPQLFSSNFRESPRK